MPPKVGKIIEVDLDFVLEQGDELVCLQLSRKSIALLLAIAHFQHWKTRWYSTGVISQDVIDTLASNAEFQLMDESNPCMTDPCCPETNELLRQLLAAQGQTVGLTLQQLDDGTPQSFAPEAPTNWDGESADSPYSNDSYNNALCSAVNDFLASAIRDAGVNLGLAATIGGLISGAIGIVNPVAGFVVRVVVGLTAAALTAAMNDTQAVQNVVCCIIRGLKGREVSASTLAGSLAASGCALSDANEQVIATVFNTYASNLDNYRAFTRHYTGQLSTDDSANTCACCNSSNWRFDYRFFKGQYPDANYIPPSYEWTADNQITIQTFYGDDSPSNPADNQRGFRVYAPEGCCFRVRIVSPDFVYPTSPNGYGVIWIDRGLAADCSTVGPDVDLSEYWCSNNFEMRWWGNDTAFPQSFPADTPIVLEFDLDYSC